jgi:RimJ/RimL family protein N-acetyltransferase
MRHDIVLSGHGIRLVPLGPDHASGLIDFVDPGMWAFLPEPMPEDAGGLRALLQSRLEDPATIPFAVTDGRTGALLGTTSLRDYIPVQQRLEVGGTFFGRQFWGTHVNPASKHLLLGYAFDELGVHRVAFRCDARNTRSAAAIKRLGARFEGVLRGHRPAADGGRSDTAVFSVLAQEWPQIREDLRRRLAPFAVGADFGLGAFAPSQASQASQAS